MPCIECRGETTFCGTGLGQRYDYRCGTPTCARYGKQQWYARHPSLWCRHPEAQNAEQDIRGHIRAIFLLEDSGTLLPIVAQCAKCGQTLTGLYSKAATAGFVHATTEDADWSKHHNDPTFTTAIECDACLANTRDVPTPAANPKST